MNVYEEIYEPAVSQLAGYGFKNAEFLAKCLVAQAFHETGDFTSPLYTNGNNLFGYGYVEGGEYQSGKQWGSGDGHYFASYSTVLNSVRELTKYLTRYSRFDRFSQVTSFGGYADALKSQGYYTADSFLYADRLNKGYDKYKNQIEGNQLDDVILPGYPAKSSDYSLLYLALGVIAAVIIFK